MLDIMLTGLQEVQTSRVLVGTLYIRRRSQLLRETQRDPDRWKQYLRLRATLLAQRYGSSGIETGSSNLSRSSSISTDHNTSVVTPRGYLVPTKQAEASRAMVGGTSIAENYAFVGVHHIFDQHTEAVTMIKFANNDKSKICCSSVDSTLSICDVTSKPPLISAILKGHSKTVTGFDWSANNDLIVSSSLDGTCRVWKVSDYSCLRIVQDSNNSQLLCCMFQPINNNLFITGNNRGELKIANVSTGRFMKNICKIGGRVLSLASDTSGKIFWVGNDKVCIL
jgi:WD40 repeat protein